MDRVLLQVHYISITAWNPFSPKPYESSPHSYTLYPSELFSPSFHQHLGFPSRLCLSGISAKFLHAFLISFLLFTRTSRPTVINAKWLLRETLKAIVCLAGVAVWRQYRDCAMFPRWPLVPQILAVYFPRWSRWSAVLKLGKGRPRVDGRLEGILLQIQPRFVRFTTPFDSDLFESYVFIFRCPEIEI